MTAAAFLLKAAEFGLTIHQAAELAALLEPAQAAPAAVPAALEKRRAYDRERKRLKAQGSGNPHGSSGGQAGGNSTGNPPETAALARGLDKPLMVVVAGEAVAAAAAPDPVDDWPEGDAHRHAQLLVLEAAAPRRLDLTRTPGLVTTTGRLAAWKRDGASWRHDVLPIVTTLARKTGPPIASWKFFDQAIAQSIADNRQALTIPEGRTAHGNAAVHPRQAPANGRADRRAAWADVFADEDRAAAGGG